MRWARTLGSPPTRRRRWTRRERRVFFVAASTKSSGIESLMTTWLPDSGGLVARERRRRQLPEVGEETFAASMRAVTRASISEGTFDSTFRGPVRLWKFDEDLDRTAARNSAAQGEAAALSYKHITLDLGRADGLPRQAGRRISLGVIARVPVRSRGEGPRDGRPHTATSSGRRRICTPRQESRRQAELHGGHPRSRGKGLLVLAMLPVRAKSTRSAPPALRAHLRLDESATPQSSIRAPAIQLRSEPQRPFHHLGPSAFPPSPTANRRLFFISSAPRRGSARRSLRRRRRGEHHRRTTLRQQAPVSKTKVVACPYRRPLIRAGSRVIPPRIGLVEEIAQPRWRALAAEFTPLAAAAR